MPRGPRRQYSQDLRDPVISKWKGGLGSRRIGRQLDIPRYSVRSIIKFFKKHGHVVVPRHKGRPPRRCFSRSTSTAGLSTTSCLQRHQVPTIKTGTCCTKTPSGVVLTPPPVTPIRRADQLHQVLYTIQDAASMWYPADLAEVFRYVHGDAVQSLQPQAPPQLLSAMCNLYQSIFSALSDDLIHGMDIRDAAPRALSSLRHDSAVYQHSVTRVMNAAVMHSVFQLDSRRPGPPGSRSPRPRNHATRRDTRSTRARPEANATIIPQRIRDQIPTVDGKQVCVRFQTAKGCTFSSCKHLHELHRLPPDVLKWVTEMHTGLKAAHPQR
jgi:hypothetical protein